MPQTNVDDFISELGAGVFKEKLAHILSEAAMGTILHGNGKKGKVTLEFTIDQISDNDQVMVFHKLSHSTPTKRGKKSEEDTTATPFYVGKGGVMSINVPEENEGGQQNAALVLTMQKDGKRA
jgi:hypothetical protein